MNTYKSGFFYYVLIVALVTLIMIYAKLGPLYMIVNHILVIFFFYIERFRFKKSLKKLNFNVYAYRVSGWSYDKRIKNILKLGKLDDEMSRIFSKYLNTMILIYVLGVSNFVSLSFSVI